MTARRLTVLGQTPELEFERVVGRERFESDRQRLPLTAADARRPRQNVADPTVLRKWGRNRFITVSNLPARASYR